MYLMNCFRYLLVSSLLLTGQLPTLSTLVFRVSLSFFNLLHWDIRWSTVCVLYLHGHSGVPIIFNQCKHDQIFPWPVIIVVTFGVKYRFTASLLSTLGKKFFGILTMYCTPFNRMGENKQIIMPLYNVAISNKVIYTYICKAKLIS
jgi:hypothetical protein